MLSGAAAVTVCRLSARVNIGICCTISISGVGNIVISSRLHLVVKRMLTVHGICAAVKIAS